jgi:hypothetical protein
MPNDTVTASESLIARAKGILLAPRDEWPKIATEQQGIGPIFTGYALPLIAIAPVAGLIGGQIFGYGAFGINYRPTLVAGISSALVSFVVALISLGVMTALVEFLAPKFDGAATRLTAFKLVAYSMTASWLAGIFAIVPSLGWLSLAGLYSFYLLYTGVVPLLNVPAAKALTFTIVTVICAIVVTLVVGAIAAVVTTALVPGPATLGSDAGEVSGNVTVPGGRRDRRQQGRQRHRAPGPAPRLHRRVQPHLCAEPGTRSGGQQCRRPL